MIRHWLRTITRIMSESLKRSFPQDQEILATQTNLINDGSGSSSNVAKKLKPTLMGISETKAGITQFINPNITGFSGLLKTLHSDFQVNEIDPLGNVIHLIDDGIDVGPSKRELKLQERAKFRQEIEGKTEEEIAEIKAAKQQEKEQQQRSKEADDNGGDGGESNKHPKISNEDREELLKFITVEELKQVEQLFHNGKNFETETKFDDKEQRTKLHQLFRKVFQNKLETITSLENTFKIAISSRNRNGGSRQQPRQFQESMHHIDENGVINYGLGPYKPYLHFTVYKQNRDTMEVANNIGKLLRINHKFINYAGTKDRRGATCQRFSINHGKVLRVNALNKLKRNGFTLGSFSYEDHPLKLGDLKGNEFTIVIRDIKPHHQQQQQQEQQPQDQSQSIESIVTSCFESLQKNGFINYFGMQRFGSFSISTHEFGKFILNENWQEFVELLLSDQESVAPGSIEARKIWKQTRDPKLTLNKLPHYFVAETAVLRVLQNESPQQKDDNNTVYSSNSYLKAIQAIPKNLRMMYGHAYQAYIWNLVASKRIELYGLNLIEGDLVFEDPITNPDIVDEDVVYLNEAKVRSLTKQDIESGKYTIFDVILPSPGYKIEYPTNPILKQVYIDIMEKDGLNPFKMIRKQKEFSLTGTYRKLMAKANNLSFELIKYKTEKGEDGETGDGEKPLIRTDLELLNLKKEQEKKSSQKSVTTPIELPDRIINDDKEGGNKLAVVLRMQLGVSSYATMALREFMRIDTSRYRDGLCK